MPYPKEFTKISWLFQVTGTEEIAETGLHITTLGTAPYNSVAANLVPSDADLQALGLEMADLMDGGSSTRYWGSYSVLTAVKIAPVGPAGNYLGPARVHELTASIAGADNGVIPQASIVISLRSGLTFGTANYGRMYLPHSALAQASGSPFATSAATNDASGAAASFIQAVNTEANTWVAGAGVVNISKVGAGSVKAVSVVAVDDLTDTQRRRLNRLNSTYDFTPVP